MILPDVNVLIYAVDGRSPLHERSRGWLEAILSGSETVGLAWSVMLAFVRLTTNPRIFDNPMPTAEAIAYIEGWLDLPCTTIVHPTNRHTALLREMLTDRQAGANLVLDAHLATLAIEHGARLASADHDFAGFPGVVWFDPTSAA